MQARDAAAAAAKSLQSCRILCDPRDGSPPGSLIPGILQARTLEWVAISFSNAWKWKVKVKSLSRVGLFLTPWTAAHQAPPSMGFSRQEYWSGVPLPSLMHILLFTYPYYFYCGHLSCFHILATVNNAAMNVCVPISLWNSIFDSLGEYIQNGTAGSRGHFIFNFFEKPSCWLLQSYCFSWLLLN